MSRVAKKPIPLPKGVEILVKPRFVTVKGPKGSIEFTKPEKIRVVVKDSVIQIESDADMIPMAGTTRAILANMVEGVSQFFHIKLDLVGVGYRASMQGKDLNLFLGYSHSLVFTAPEGVTLTTPTQTEIVVAGFNKQQVGEVAAKIRRYRPPEPYKGKGVKYSDEVINRKEAKKA